MELIYAAGHCHAPRYCTVLHCTVLYCHAPSCISMELYHADTGMLLCSHYPVYGETHQVGTMMMMMMMMVMMMMMMVAR